MSVEDLKAELKRVREVAEAREAELLERIESRDGVIIGLQNKLNPRAAHSVTCQCGHCVQVDDFEKLPILQRSVLLSEHRACPGCRGAIERRTIQRQEF